ncbi:MAG: MFS transporter [Acetobacteraceae bacterium]
MRCWIGLNALNFFIAAAQTGFGPFFSVYLTEQNWNQADIGIALSIGTASVLAFQLPSGALVDMIRHKRFANGLGLVLVGASAVMLAAHPTEPLVWSSQLIHSLGSCILGPAIAALTLALAGQTAFSERIGINARYASIGNALAAALFGALVTWSSNRAAFIASALLCVAGLATLPLFRATDSVPVSDHPAMLTPSELRDRSQHPWHIFAEPALHVFAICAVLFSVANAAMLPLALNELAKRTDDTGFVVSAAIIVPQIVVAACSPWVGRLAETIGRRPILLLGFVALPARALLFTTLPDAVPLVMMQVLDGVSATVFGLMVPLIAADVTRRTGYLNLAISSLSLAAGLGATFSTTAAGWIADTMGAPAAFMTLAVVGAAAVALLWAMMPETRPGKPVAGEPATVV